MNRLPQPGAAVSEPVDVPAHPARIRDLDALVLTQRRERELWHTLMAREPPHGMTIFAGCPVRDLVGSGHGWPGVLGFPVAALRVSARDRWMAWSDDGRRDHLYRVVCLSCFLIRPSVRCPHLTMGRGACCGTSRPVTGNVPGW
ncbi:MAG: DUF4338 domain-containing protein [Alphaproteobacteria bacterium]|nr:DUF4338 domain-containing protein [Alphaproteobacteria bacterium]